MSARKMWNRADARAEMNRIVRGAASALQALAETVKTLEELGVETGFEDDAFAAGKVLRDRVAGALLMKAPVRPAAALGHREVPTAEGIVIYEPTPIFNFKEMFPNDRMICVSRKCASTPESSDVIVRRHVSGRYMVYKGITPGRLVSAEVLISALKANPAGTMVVLVPPSCQTDDRDLGAGIVHHDGTWRVVESRKATLDAPGRL